MFVTVVTVMLVT